MSRFARRRDANHGEIKRAFERFGFLVEDVANLGGFCDLIIGKSGRMRMVEVKDGDKPPSQRKLRKGQVELSTKWNGYYYAVQSVDDVMVIARDWNAWHTP